MGNTFYFTWEVDLIVWIQNFLNDFGVTLCSFFSLFGEALLSVFVMATLYFAIDKNLGKKVALNLVLIQAFYPLVKNVALRRRPYMDSSEIECLKLIDSSADAMDIKAQGYSFPSGHSASAFSLYGSLAYFLRKRWMTIVAVVITLFVGISRFSLGVHYPTDVLVGYGLGAFVVFLMPVLQKKIKSLPLFYGIIALVILPGWFFCTTNDYFSGFGMTLGFMIADLFERKYVQFENPKNIGTAILRTLGGIGVFAVFEIGLKLPFSKDFLDAPEFLPHLVRALRYIIAIFATMGLYPLLFKVLANRKFGLFDHKEKVAKTSEEE